MILHIFRCACLSAGWAGAALSLSKGGFLMENVPYSCLPAGRRPLI